jgi:hypothetical protein
MFGERLPKPGFCIPKSSFCGLGRGFFRLDRSGPRLVIIVDPSVIVDPKVDPFETEVTVVATEPKLPAYGLPDETVIDIPRSKNLLLIRNVFQISFITF